MSDRDDYVYPEEVCYEIPEGDHASYRQAADYINRCGYEVLSVQHEYGIFGGEAGAYLMSLVREAKMPIVTTLHTVLREPTLAQKRVIEELLQLSERIVVMSKKAISLLVDVHGVDLDKIDLIPHGIPEVHESHGRELRSKLSIDGPMILTFGLLSPDKGIQYVIEAMPNIVRDHPGATYVVLGATHPHVRSSAGEAYRESLVKLSHDLGVASNIRFVNRFVALEELVAYLGAMDVYVTPYLNPNQITSGTLAYAVGAGKAVISTPYWYAQELLAGGRGLLVPFREADPISTAVLTLQKEPEVSADMGRRAADYGRSMLWPEVGKSYLATFARARRESEEGLRAIAQKPILPMEVPKPLPSLVLSHLFDLSDDTGILQHATFSVPNRSEGYCVDDNARALLLTAYLEDDGPLEPDISLLQGRYLSFLLAAYNSDRGRFRNFMSYGREWLEETGSEDSHGRSMWALGAVANRCRSRGRRQLAKSLFERAAATLPATTSPRTWAYVVLAADEYLRAFPHEYSIQVLKQTMAARIWRQYEINQAPDWLWCEQSLAYCNARLPQALIVAGEELENRNMLQVGAEALEWLMRQQTGPEGEFAPIGTNGFYIRGANRSYFDQQPVEACCSVSACLSAARITGDPLWVDESHRAFRWFLGENMLGQPVYDKSNGGCHDGLHADRMNMNQGAESTLSFLCSLAEMRKAAALPIPLAVPRNHHELQ